MRSALLPVVAAGCAWMIPAGASASEQAASDFTQPVPAAKQVAEPTARQARIAAHRNGYGIEGRVLYRTRTVEAPRRFDLVGVAGEMHALEFRVREHGGDWSDWSESADGDPVYTGGSDELQIRSRTVPIEGQLHYVSLPAPPKVAPQPQRHGTTATTARRAGVPKPKFIGRAAWGANAKEGGCIPREAPLTGRVKAGVIHHTVSANDYSEAEAPGMVLGICRYHRNANGWNDIGYNALVDRFGNLYQGRAGGLNRAIVGAQAEGHNSQTTGIASIGTHTDVGVHAATREGLIDYLAWKLDLAGLDATGQTSLTSAGGETTRTPKGQKIRVYRVLSHSDTNFTECAGIELRAQIPAIRRDVQERIDSFGGGSTGGSGGSDTGPPSGGTTPKVPRGRR